MMKLHEPERQRLEALLHVADHPRLVGSFYGDPRGYRVTQAGDSRRRWTVMLQLVTAWLQRRYIEHVDKPLHIGAAKKAKEGQMTAIQIAQIVHEANRAYCQTLGDGSQVSWDEAPEWQRESAVSGVRGIISGLITKPEQSHESWLAEKQRTGWKYGAVKNAETKEHPCFVPYAELPPEQQAKDAIFFAIVNACK